MHAPLEAALGICLRAARPVNEIEAINVGINSSAMSMAGGLYRCDSVASAQLSIPYGVALGLSGRPGLADDFESSVIADEQLFQLAQKVAVHISPQMEELRLTLHKSAAQVEVVYCDGNREYQEIHDARGHLGNPLDERTVIDKFLALATAAVGMERAGDISRQIMNGDAEMPADELFRQWVL